MQPGKMALRRPRLIQSNLANAADKHFFPNIVGANLNIWERQGMEALKGWGWVGRMLHEDKVKLLRASGQRQE